MIAKSTSSGPCNPEPFARAYPFLIFLLAVIAAVLGSGLSTAAETAGPGLSLEQYLGQASSGNQTGSAAMSASEGAGLRLSEARLLYSPVFDATAEWVRDKRQSPFLKYDQSVNDVFEAGISEMTPWGLRGRVSYNLTHTGYEGLVFGVGGSSPPVYYYGSPRIELTLDLWRNLFGAESRAQHEMIEASALSAKFGQSYQAKVSRAAAESAYIRLAAARELDQVNHDSFDHAKEISDWNARRSKLNLNEDSDLYQAQASLESARLLVAAGSDGLRTASRAFNLARGVDSDTVTETLALPDPKSAKVPERAGIRDDVRAAQEQQRIASANAQMGMEKNRPTLQLFGAYARNSQQIERSEAITRSFDANEPTKIIGVRFTMPLALGDSADARAGYGKERVAAEKLLDQKTFDQEVEWKDLVQKLADAKGRLEIAEKLAGIQKKKALNERNRLKKGRTTTYQSLIFENDYNQAEYQRIQTQSEVLTLLAQMRTYGG
jgi:outer membrane protein TolC